MLNSVDLKGVETDTLMHVLLSEDKLKGFKLDEEGKTRLLKLGQALHDIPPEQRGFLLGQKFREEVEASAARGRWVIKGGGNEWV